MSARDNAQLHSVLSGTLGLPAMLWTLSDQSVPLPLPIDDEYLSSKVQIQNHQPSGQPSRLHFFKHALILSDILTEMISDLYSSAMDREFLRKVGSTSRNQIQHTSIIGYESRLNEFWNSLPAHLRSSKNVDGTAVEESDRLFSYQSAVLRARYVDTIRPRSNSLSQYSGFYTRASF